MLSHLLHSRASRSKLRHPLFPRDPALKVNSVGGASRDPSPGFGLHQTATVSQKPAPVPVHSAALQRAEPTKCLYKNGIQTGTVLPSGQNPEQGLLPRSPCSQEQEAIARASQDLQVVYFPTVAGLGNECHVKYIRGHYHARERRAVCQESYTAEEKHSEVAKQPSMGNLACHPMHKTLSKHL